MRRFHFALVLTCLLFPFLAMAQQFEAGWTAGVNFAQVDGDNLSGYNKLGGQLGISVSRELKQPWSLRGEMLFTMKGAARRLLVDNTPNPNVLRSTLLYVEVPLLVQYRLKKFKFEGGPSFGVIVRGTREDQFGKFVNTDTYKRLEYAVHLGAAYALESSWEVYSRFSYSLACISGSNCQSILVSAKVRAGDFNNVITVGVRKKFNR